MSDNKSESPSGMCSKRFAFKKEICDLKTYKKFYKQYLKASPIGLIQRKLEKQEHERLLAKIGEL